MNLDALFSRRALLTGVGLTAIGVIGRTLFSLDGPSKGLPNLSSHSEMQAYVNRVAGQLPNYVSVEYKGVSDFMDEYKVGYVPGDVFTLPIGEEGKGARSKIYLLDTFFSSLYEEHSQMPPEEFKSDLEIIVRNTIHRESVRAKHMNQGIGDYPKHLFYGSDGKFNQELFTLVSTALASQSQYLALSDNERTKTSGVLQLRATSAKRHAQDARRDVYYKLPDLSGNMDEQFIEGLKRDFDPQDQQKLFPDWLINQPPHPPSQ